ncbi:MAG: tetratricopeptide repeat protein [Candidatus Gastranaerophilaceae bacterium]
MFNLWLIQNRIKKEGETTELLCRLAEYYLKKKNYEKQLAYAEKAIFTDDCCNKAYFLKGSALYNLNNLQESKKSLLLAEKYGNKSSDLYSILGHILLEEKNYKKALNMANRLISKNDKDSYGYYLKGCAEYYLEDENALSTFFTAEKFGCKGDNMYYHIIDIYRKKKEYTKALKYADKLIKRNKKSSDAYYIKGIILFDQNKYEEAMEYLLLADEMGCKHFLLFYCMSYIYGAIGKQYEESIEYADKAIEQNPDNDFPYYIKGCFLYKLKEYQKAKISLLKAEQLGNKSKDIFPKLLYIFSLEKNYNKSIEYADKIIAKRPDNNSAYYKKGWALYNLGDYTNAKEALLQAEKLGNQTCDTFAILSYIFSTEKLYEKSYEYANKAIGINPKNSYYYYRKGRALYKIGSYSSAKSALTKSEELGYKSCDMFSMLSYISGMDEDYSKSLEYANKAVFQNQQNGYAFFLKGQALYKLQDYEKAKTTLIKAEELGFANDILYSDLSYIYSLEKDNEKSIEYADMAIGKNPDNNIPYYRKGWALYIKEDFESAEKYLLKAEELGCDFDNMYALLSCMYYIESDFKLSLKYIDKAILQNDKCKEYYFVKAKNLLNLNREEEAKICYARVNELAVVNS